MSFRDRASLCSIHANTTLPFGLKVVILKHKTNSKLEERGIDVIALRQSNKSHGYRIYSPSTHSIIDTTNFDTHKFTKPVTLSTFDDSSFDHFFNILNCPIIEEISKFSTIDRYDFTDITITVAITI